MKAKADTHQRHNNNFHGEFKTFDTIHGEKFHSVARRTFLVSHSLAALSAYQTIFGIVPRSKLALDVILVVISTLGITVGCHRLWAHRSFKATLPLRILLMLMQTLSFQRTIYKWVLDHRIHHKYTDTDADPHNSKRGFWFSHIGWLVSPSHPENQRAMESFRMPDLERDAVVRFQNKWYWILLPVVHLILPVYAYMTLFELTLFQALASNALRHVVQIHITFTVNSFAHMWGHNKPYDRNISSVELPLISFLTTGEGWHNYHHTYPSDYKASEFPWTLNLATMFIDFFSWIGWAYDLKSVPKGVVTQRKCENDKRAEKAE